MLVYFHDQVLLKQTMTKIQLSNNFKQKLKCIRDIKINIETEPTLISSFSCLEWSSSHVSDIILEIDISDHSKSKHDFNECIKWQKLLEKEPQNSLDIGPFKGLIPIKLDYPIITMIAKDFKYEPSWRDWFIVEEEEE
jgi:hypothetical protein